MRKYLLATVSVAALAAAQPAHAGPPMPMPVYNWAGWYAGGNVGYSFGNENSNFTDPGFTSFTCCNATTLNGHQRLDGVIGGGQVGYNWQPNPYAVFGLEADFQGTNEKNTASYSTTCEGYTGGGTFDTSCGIKQSSSIGWFGTVRGRVGWLITPTIMPYVTAGLAYGEVKASGTVSGGYNVETGCFYTCQSSWSKSQVNVGFAGGFGVEAAFPGSSNWTWKVEYLYINLGTLGGTGYDPTYGTTYTWNNSFTDNIVRGGINYYFH
jgi:outer membrane immunogenic protein